MQSDCVLCEIGNEFLRSLGSHPGSYGSISGQSTSDCGEKRGSGTSFSSSISVFPCSIIPTMLHTIFILIILLPEGQAGEAWEPSNKAMPFRISGSIL